MLPKFRPGDHVITFNWLRPKRGDAIVFNNNSKQYLKRIDKLNKERIVVSGDNKARSAIMNPITKEQVIGKVLLSY